MMKLHSDSGTSESINGLKSEVSSKCSAHQESILSYLHFCNGVWTIITDYKAKVSWELHCADNLIDHQQLWKMWKVQKMESMAGG